MRIAQIAPLIESVPPRFYGGTERVVSYLTEGLVTRGHRAMAMSAEGHWALRLLAGSPLGVTEAIMLAHGFTNGLLGRSRTKVWAAMVW